MSIDKDKSGQDKKAGVGKKKEIVDDVPPPLEKVIIPEELTTVEENIREK